MKKYILLISILTVFPFFLFSCSMLSQKHFTYVALGDSYTIGEGVGQSERWPDQLIQRLKEKGIILDLLANPSVTGYTTLDVTDRELPRLRNISPDIITLQIGVNDFFQGVSLEEFSSRYTRLLEDILRISPHSLLVLIDIPDYGKTPYGRQTGDPRVIHDGITLYNTRIRTIAENYHLPVADVFIPSLLVEMDASLTTSDGLHPSGKQYALWVENILPRVMDTLSAF